MNYELERSDSTFGSDYRRHKSRTPRCARLGMKRSGTTRPQPTQMRILAKPRSISGLAMIAVNLSRKT